MWNGTGKKVGDRVPASSRHKKGCTTLTRGQLKKNAKGKIVSKAKSDLGKTGPGGKQVMRWGKALGEARKELGITAWVVGTFFF